MKLMAAGRNIIDGYGQWYQFAIDSSLLDEPIYFYEGGGPDCPICFQSALDGCCDCAEDAYRHLSPQEEREAIGWLEAGDTAQEMAAAAQVLGQLIENDDGPFIEEIMDLAAAMRIVAGRTR